MTGIGGREGLYWGEVVRLLERCKRQWSVLRFYKSSHGYKKTISICDFTLPRRKPVTQTAIGEQDAWYAHTYVSNISLLDDNWVPRGNSVSEWNEAKQEFEEVIVQGLSTTLSQLLADGCISKTEEVEAWLR